MIGTGTSQMVRKPTVSVTIAIVPGKKRLLNEDRAACSSSPPTLYS